MAKQNDIKRLASQIDLAIIRAGHLGLPLVVHILSMARLELDQVASDAAASDQAGQINAL